MPLVAVPSSLAVNVILLSAVSSTARSSRASSTTMCFSWKELFKKWPAIGLVDAVEIDCGALHSPS